MTRRAQVTLYAIPGSNSALVTRLMLAHKGVAYRTVELPPALHPVIVPALGFRQTTVPALKIDGRRVQNTRRIARVLDELHPDPPLFAADAGRRREVEEAERWGEEVLQPVPRQLVWFALSRKPKAFGRAIDELEMPRALRLAAKPSTRVLIPLARLRTRATATAARAGVAALPGILDRIDAWIAEGVLDGDQPCAADFQIAASVRMLLALADVAPLIEARPAGAHALRVVPHYPRGLAAGALPHEWLASVTDAAHAPS